MSTPESLKVISIREIDVFFAGVASGPSPDNFVKIAPVGPARGRVTGADGSSVIYDTGVKNQYTVTITLLRTSSYNANLTAAFQAGLVGPMTIVDGSGADLFFGVAAIEKMPELTLNNGVANNEWTFIAEGTLIAGGA